MQDLRNLITDEQKDLMNMYIESYAVGDGNYYTVNYHRRANIDTILKPWAEAKGLSMLGLMFQDSLIKSEHIDYTVPTRSIEMDMRKDSKITRFLDAFYDWISNFEQWCRVDNGMGWSDWSTIGNALFALDSYYTLAQNCYDGEEVRIPTPDGHQIIVAQGCKPVKMLGKINAAFHISEDFEAFRIAVSQHLNVAKLHGELCLSIHPMDYMTMSDNDCDWDSCMSWRRPGEYRQGTVEMMNSPYVVVAYLNSSQPMKIFGHEWTNKKWRSLYIVHPDFIGSIKGYPYQLPEVDKLIINKLKKMAAKAGFQAKYGNVIAYDYPELESAHGTVYLDFSAGYMYSDFGSVRHYGCVREDEHQATNIDINFSGMPECMWCGDIYEEESEESLTCPDCYEMAYCDCCGRHFGERELIETGNGERVCEDCLCSDYQKSFSDDEYYRYDSMARVFVVHDKLADAIENGQLIPENFDWQNPYILDAESGDVGPDDLWGNKQFSRFLKEGHEIKFVKKQNYYGRTSYVAYIFLSDLTEDWQDEFVCRHGYCETIMGESFDDLWCMRGCWWANDEARHDWAAILDEENAD